MKHLFKTENLNKLFWNTIYILPLLIYVIGTINNSMNLTAIVNSMGILSNNIITSTINDCLGSDGIFPLIEQNSSIVYFLSYYVILNIIHIVIDITLLLPRIAQQFSDKISNSGDDGI